MSNSSVTLIIKAELTNIALVGAVVRALCVEFDLDMVVCTEVELAVVEATTNIIKYGLAHRPQESIQLIVSYHNAQLEIILQDKGVPMPPEALINADGSVFDYDVENIDTWPTSGMGLSLIKAVMTHVNYDASAEGNSLHLIKHISPTIE